MLVHVHVAIVDMPNFEDQTFDFAVASCRQFSLQLMNTDILTSISLAQALCYLFFNNRHQYHQIALALDLSDLYQLIVLRSGVEKSIVLKQSPHFENENRANKSQNALIVWEKKFRQI